MKLIIDNSGDSQAIFYLKERGAWKKEEVAGEKALLEKLEKALKKNKKKINDISGIAVIVGKGRFTAERIATTMANTLAFALGIPVIALSDFDAVHADKKFKSAKKGLYISAKYSGNAHIGGKNI